MNRKNIQLKEPAWFEVIEKISRFEPQVESNFSVETQKLSLEGSALFVGSTMHLRISFLSTLLSDKLKDYSYLKTSKKMTPNSKLMAFDEINMNLKAPLREVLGFIQALTQTIKMNHPHIKTIELTAETIHNERLYKKLKSLHFKEDIPFFKRLIQAYYVTANAALYSFLVTGIPHLEFYEAAFVSLSNAALFWIPVRAKFKKFKQEGVSLKLTIPLVEGDNLRPNNKPK